MKSPIYKICLFLALFTALYSKEKILSVDGASLYYTLQGKGKPIVFIHGGPGLNHYYLKTNLEALSKDYLTIFYDQRGSGNSTSVINKQYINMKSFVEDLETIRKDLEQEQIAIIGHSFGCLLALHYASTYPCNVEKLILLSPLPIDDKGYEKYLNNALELSKPYETILQTIQEREGFKYKLSEDVQKFLKVTFRPYFAYPQKANDLDLYMPEGTGEACFKIHDMFKENYFLDYNLHCMATNLSCPTLIIHGDRDPIPLVYAIELNQLIKSSKLQVFESCGHFPYLEKKHQTLQHIKDFLKQ